MKAEGQAAYRLSLYFTGEQAEQVRQVIGKDQARGIVELCREVASRAPAAS